MELEDFQLGDRVRCDPSGIEGAVYAIASRVIYVRLAKGEVITSPVNMLHQVDPLCVSCRRHHQPSQGHFGTRVL